MDLRLSGRIAVVTGASKGIGLATTRTLLEEGARVVAASRKNNPELDALATRGPGSRPGRSDGPPGTCAGHLPRGGRIRRA